MRANSISGYDDYWPLRETETVWDLVLNVRDPDSLWIRIGLLLRLIVATAR